MDGRKIEQGGFSKAWRKRIGANLPRRLTPARRDALTSIIAERIQRWVEIEPEIAPHREKRKRLAAERDKFQAAIERIKAGVAKLSTDPGLGMSRNTAEGALYRVANNALNELAGWNHLWRPEKARPRDFAVQLTKALQEEYRRVCGSLRGFERLLIAIRVEHPTLPELTLGALEKRKQRAH
jgi:hypothetical protein